MKIHSQHYQGQSVAEHVHTEIMKRFVYYGDKCLIQAFSSFTIGLWRRVTFAMISVLGIRYISGLWILLSDTKLRKNISQHFIIRYFS